MNKVVFIREPVSEDVANNMIALSLYLDSVDKKRIYYWLNCPGGDVSGRSRAAARPAAAPACAHACMHARRLPLGLVHARLSCTLCRRRRRRVCAALAARVCCLQVAPTLALYDTMQYVRSPTATVCYGMCLGMGGFLLTAGGEKVRRHQLLLAAALAFDRGALLRAHCSSRTLAG